MARVRKFTIPLAASILTWACFGSCNSSPAAEALSCNQDQVVDSLQKLAGKFVNSNNDALFHYVKMPHEDWQTANGIFVPPPLFEVSGFRDRGEYGRSGLRCAAAVKTFLKPPATLDLIAEYTVERSIDGKIFVTAQFQPNR